MLLLLNILLRTKLWHFIVEQKILYIASEDTLFDRLVEDANTWDAIVSVYQPPDNGRAVVGLYHILRFTAKPVCPLSL